MTVGSAPLPPATRRSILLLSLAAFSSMATQRICDAMLPELSRVFDASLAQAARVVSAFAVVYGLSQLIYGPLGDRLGKFRIVSYAAAWCALGNVLAMLATSLDLLVAARVMVALGAAAIIPMCMAWTGDAAPPDRLQETLARVGLGTTLGIVGGQLMGGLFTDTLGWRWAFGFMALLFGVVAGLLLTDWRRQQAAPEMAQRRPAVRPAFTSQALLILRDSWSRTVLLTGFIEGVTGFGVLAIWASHLHREMGLSLSAAGGIVALVGVGGMVYMAVASPLFRRFGQPALVILGSGLLGLATLVLAFVPHWAASAAASLLGGFGFFMFHNTMQAHAAQMAPAARGTSVSFFALSVFSGQSLGVSIAAGVMERAGSSAVIVAAGAGIACLGVWFARALRGRERLRRETGS